MIVSYMAFNKLFEEEFDSKTTIKELHEYLVNICKTYVITDIRKK